MLYTRVRTLDSLARFVLIIEGVDDDDIKKSAKGRKTM